MNANPLRGMYRNSPEMNHKQLVSRHSCKIIQTMLCYAYTSPVPLVLPSWTCAPQLFVLLVLIFYLNKLIITNNRLVEIPQNEWPALQQLYRNRKKEACSWNLLQNYINWFARDSTISNVRVYSLNGDWSDGTFIIQDGSTLMFNTLDDCQERLFDALECIDQIAANSTRDYYSLHDFVHRVKPTVDRFMGSIGADVTVIWYHMSREEALNFKVDPPQGVTVAPLTQANVECINDLWPYRKSGSDAFISRLIRLNLHAGAFGEDGSLLAWCVQMPMGFLGLLHVRDDQRRKGLGSLVVMAMARIMAEKGIEVTASVVESNEKSRKMFEGLGFKEIDRLYWVKRPISRDDVMDK